MREEGRPAKSREEASHNARQVAAAVDRPVIANFRFSTTLRVPVDRRMLVGGMTYEGRPKPGDRGLYVFLKASVQELRDDAVKKPSAKAPPKTSNGAKKPAKPGR